MKKITRRIISILTAIAVLTGSFGIGSTSVFADILFDTEDPMNMDLIESGLDQQTFQKLLFDQHPDMFQTASGIAIAEFIEEPYISSEAAMKPILEQLEKNKALTSERLAQIQKKREESIPPDALAERISEGAVNAKSPLLRASADNTYETCDKYPVAPFGFDTARDENISINTGGLFYKETDLVLPGKSGLDLVIGIKYDSSKAESIPIDDLRGTTGVKPGKNPSKNSNMLRKFAYGWSFQFSSMETEGRNTYFTLADGRTYLYNKWGVGNLMGNSTCNVEADRAVNEFAYGNRYSAFRLRYLDGRTEYFDIDGYLIGIVDRFGNAIKFLYGMWGSENTYVTITDTYGRDTYINRDSWAGEIRVKLPDERTFTYYADYWLNSKCDLDGYWTAYDHEYSEHMFHDTMRLASYGTMDEFRREVSSYAYYQINGYYMNANLVKITYPSGASTEYEYYTGSSSHTHWDGSRDVHTHDNQRQSVHYATLGKKGFQGIAVIKSRKDISNGAVYNYREYKYNGGSSTNYSGDLSSLGNYSDSLPSGHQYVTEIWDNSAGVRYRYTFDRYHNETYEERYPLSGGASFYFETSLNYKVIGNVRTALPEYVSITENDVKTTETYLYDANGQVTKHVISIPGKEDYTYTADYMYGIPRNKKYLKDNGTRIEEKNTPTADMLAIGKSEVFENDVLKKMTTYGYNGDGTMAWRRDYKDPNTYIETTYGYTYVRRFDYPEEPVTEYTVSVLRNGITEKYVYDKTSRLSKYIDGRQNATSYAYGSSLVRQINPDNSSISTYYLKSSNTINIINELGYSKSYEYAPLGQISAVKEDGSLVASFQHKPDMKLLSETDGNGNKHEYSYDIPGRLLSDTVKNGTTQLYSEIYSYENSGSSSDQNISRKVYKTIPGEAGAPEIKTVAYYDMLGRLTREAFMEGNSVSSGNTYAYNFTGDLTSFKSALDESKGTSVTYTKQYTVDFEGKTLTEKNREEGVISATYDMLGRKISAVDAMNRTSYYTYDDSNRLISENIPFEGSYHTVKTYSYDNAGNLTEERITNNKPGSAQSESRTTYTYNNRNMLTNVKFYDGTVVASSVSYSYDRAGNLKETTNGRMNKTTYSYDKRGRLISVKDSLGQSESYTYDGNSNIKTVTDRNGNQIAYTYNWMNKLLTANAKKSDGSSATEYLTNTYALTGALKRQQNENMTVDYTYDNHGRNISQTETGGISKTYTYNPGDLRTAFTLSVNGSPQLSLSYEYDIIGRPSQVKNNGSVIASYSSYDKNHNLLMASYPVPGINTSYTYGEADQLKTMTSAKGSTPLASYSYSYYLDGNQESKTEGGVKTSYVYYGHGALKSESTPTDSKTYTYDQAGNRKTMDVRGSEVYTVAYEYDNNSRLSKERKVKGAVTDLDFYYYDKNGNQIGRMHETAQPSVATATPSLEMSLLSASANSGIQSELRFYDSFNRLRSVNSNVGETLYAYRPDNLRLSKTLNGSKTTHIWDGQDIVAELGNTNAVIGRYFRGNGELIGTLNSSNTMQYYLHNGHGDVTGLTSAAGAVTKSYAYDAFGNERNKATNDPNPFRYAGEYFDNETGSIYLRARYYSPTIGRFAAEDPARDGANWYAYCGNNPVLQF